MPFQLPFGRNCSRNPPIHAFKQQRIGAAWRFSPRALPRRNRLRHSRTWRRERQRSRLVCKRSSTVLSEFPAGVSTSKRRAGCDWAALGTASLTRALARQGERKKPSVSTLGTNAHAVESRQGRQKHMI